jgi:Chaperone of endosialidase
MSLATIGTLLFYIRGFDKIYGMKLKYICAGVCAIALVPALSSAQTWTAPTQTAPAGNVGAPLNVSSTGQVKAGGISIGSLIVTGASTFNGDVSAPAFLYSSDKTLKKGIETLTESLSKVLGLRGVSFQWKSDGRKDIGLIAQEVEKVVPEAVHTNSSTGLKSVEYGNIVGLLIEAVKAQQVEIDALKAEVKSLKK